MRNSALVQVNWVDKDWTDHRRSVQSQSQDWTDLRRSVQSERVVSTPVRCLGREIKLKLDFVADRLTVYTELGNLGLDPPRLDHGIGVHCC